MKEISKISVKVFHPLNRGFDRLTIVASHGKNFTDGGIDQALEHVADQVDRKFPDHEYGLVQIGPDQFNFVWRSERKSFVAAQSAMNS